MGGPKPPSQPGLITAGLIAARSKGTFYTWYLMFGVSLHHIGAGIAMCLTSFLQVGMAYAYISFSAKCAGKWRGFTRAAFRDWKPYLQLAIPGLLVSKNVIGDAMRDRRIQ